MLEVTWHAVLLGLLEAQLTQLTEKAPGAPGAPGDLARGAPGCLAQLARGPWSWKGPGVTGPGARGGWGWGWELRFAWSVASCRLQIAHCGKCLSLVEVRGSV